MRCRWRVHAAIAPTTFRRGHAVDLQRGGASLCTILEAGQWKTKSFADHQKMHLVKADAVLEVGTPSMTQSTEHQCVFISAAGTYEPI